MDDRPREREDGEVSEASNLEDAGAAETPSDAVAGHPTDDDVQEGSTGPNARSGRDGETGGTS